MTNLNPQQFEDEDGNYLPPSRPHVFPTYEESGTEGNATHITYEEQGFVPADVLANMPGSMGEVPGEHRKRQGKEWDVFRGDIQMNGMDYSPFVMIGPENVGPNAKPVTLAEGNHRRDAAVELGWPTIPVQVRYTGHAERHRRLWSGDQ